MFDDRSNAGRQLAEKLKEIKYKNLLILALPRGGVPIGYEVAQVLHAPLDVIVARKVGLPWNPELGIGAVAPGVQILDEASLKMLGLNRSDIKPIIAQEQAELTRRILLYRGNEELPKIAGKTVILVDDGLATGITARAAFKAIKQLKPEKLILAVPVGSFEAINLLKESVDELICLKIPPHFYAVSAFYHNFPQVSDEEVVDLLRKAKKELS
ncbi:MAG: phosphoribosyltransferase [Alphaproteobacteria bacterium]|nr:phosphoribosyltransferase [Alphaproteobacteria bacterium]